MQQGSNAAPGTGQVKGPSMDLTMEHGSTLDGNALLFPLVGRRIAETQFGKRRNCLPQNDVKKVPNAVRRSPD